MIPQAEPTRIGHRRRRMMGAVGAAVALPALAGIGNAKQVNTVVDFDPPDQPENLAIDDSGNIYMSMALTRELRKLPAVKTTKTGLDKDDTELVATLPDANRFVTGVATDSNGTLYAADTNLDNSSNTPSFVWSIPPDGPMTTLATLPDDAFPNGVLIDDDHDRLLVSDSLRGAVWAVAQDGSGAKEWLNDPLLDPDSFVGANGVAVSEGVLHVANLDFGRIVRIPIDTDGSAGSASVFVEADSLVGADGITFHNPATLHVAVNSQNAIRRVNGAGKIKTVVAGAPLDAPADVAFDPRDRGRLFVANFAFGSDPETANPALLRTHP